AEAAAARGGGIAGLPDLGGGDGETACSGRACGGFGGAGKAGGEPDGSAPGAEAWAARGTHGAGAAALGGEWSFCGKGDAEKKSRAGGDSRVKWPDSAPKTRLRPEWQMACTLQRFLPSKN